MRDPWFWAFIVVLVLWFLRACYRMAKDQRDLDKFFREWKANPPAPPIDEDLRFDMQLCIRRLYYLSRHNLESGQTASATYEDARRLLKHSDFEIPAGE